MKKSAYNANMIINTKDFKNIVNKYGFEVDGDPIENKACRKNNIYVWRTYFSNINWTWAVLNPKGLLIGHKQFFNLIDALKYKGMQGGIR